MKKSLLLVFTFLYLCTFLNAQSVSVRVAQASYDNTDPDGAGPATGSVTIHFELSATANLLADGIPFSMVYQSSKLMATPTNTTVKTGPLAAAPTNWSQTVDNRAGNSVNVTYGGNTFDKRMIISFSQPVGVPDVPVGATVTAYVDITYWTLGTSYPQGGFITPEPGAILAQNELSTDGGQTTYPYLSPDLNTPVPLGASVTPVTFSSFNVKCSDKGASIAWATETESNSSHFEIQKSQNGNEWTTLNSLASTGNSSSHKDYQYLDLQGGKGFYRIRQVDLDGKSFYTNVIPSTCTSRSLSVAVYPVPADNNITVAIQSDKEVKTTLQIVDATGRVVIKQNAVIKQGNNNLVIDVHQLPSGKYILMSSDASIYLNKIFIVSR